MKTKLMRALLLLGCLLLPAVLHAQPVGGGTGETPSVPADSIGLTELDDSDDTPAANEVVVVDPSNSYFNYVATGLLRVDNSGFSYFPTDSSNDTLAEFFSLLDSTAAGFDTSISNNAAAAAGNADDITALQTTDTFSGARIDNPVQTVNDTTTIDEADNNKTIFYTGLSGDAAQEITIADADKLVTLINLDGTYDVVVTCSGTLTDLHGATVTSLTLDTGQGMTFLSIGSDDIRAYKQNVERSLGRLTIEEPTGSEDLTVAYLPNATTITRQIVVLTGSVTSLTCDVHHGTDRSAAGTALITSPSASTSTSTGTSVTSFDNAVAAAASWLWLETDAVAGDTGTAFIELFGYEN